MATIKGDDFDNNEINDDPLDGTTDNDTIYGYDGDDDLFGYEGNDVLRGGSGNDNLYGGSGINNLYGGKGEDWFVFLTRGSRSSDTFIADFTFDRDRIDVSDWGVSDFSQIDALLTEDTDGNALLSAGYGGKSHVITIGDVSADDLASGDFVYSDRGARDIGGTSKSDTLFGSRGSDEIQGNGGSDRILGGAGNDDIFGGSGNDRIWGGSGADDMTGGDDADRFSFLRTSDMTSSSGRDHITDFTPDVDLIDFSRIDADVTDSGNQKFEWIGSLEFDDDAPGELRYYYSGDDTIIAGNTDNDDNSEFRLVVEGRFKPIEDDFIL